MSTPATAIAGGFFAQLMPMLADRTVMMIVSKADEQHLTISVIPKRTKDSENAALLTPNYRRRSGNSWPATLRWAPTSPKFNVSVKRRRKPRARN
jgi:hypothetical protein